MHDLTKEQELLLRRELLGSRVNNALSAAEEADIERHTMGRLQEFRSTFIPWLSDNMALSAARVLEIGAGTGASTVAMAEQGAVVHGIDISEESLRIAKLRCQFHGISSTTFDVMNATHIGSLKSEWDFIIFFATLEHMTHRERIIALKASWDLLPVGGFLSVVECPNRLWYYDNHTTLTNFYQWLPDEVAIDYAAYIDRAEFKDAMARNISLEEKSISLARWGRGGSFHEIEIAIGPISQLNIRDGMDDYARRKNADLADYWNNSADGRYRDAIMAVSPGVQSAFFYPWLNILIQKT